MIDILREFRILDYAVFDFTASLIGVYLLAPRLTKMFLKLKINIPKKSWLYLTIPISILIHLLFGQMTLLTKNFIYPQGHYVVKIFVLGLLLLGVKDIKRTK